MPKVVVTLSGGRTERGKGVDVDNFVLDCMMLNAALPEPCLPPRPGFPLIPRVGFRSRR